MSNQPSNSVSAVVPLAEQVSQANDSGRVPVVFIHGLWLLPSSWDRWAAMFAEAGYAPVSPGWPDDPDTVAEANASPGSSRTRPSAWWPTTTRKSSGP